MKRPLFEHRHFAWLANWAKVNLNGKQIDELCTCLRDTNPNFDGARFILAATSKPMGLDQARCNRVPYPNRKGA